MKIKCRLCFMTADRIQAIKLVNQATGRGLREAKDFCDVAWNDLGQQYPTPVVMSVDQFGKFELLSRLHPDGPLISFSAISIMDEPEKVFDMTAV